MIESVQTLPLLILLMGVAIALAILIKVGLESLGLPALVGYLGLGFLLRLADAQGQILSAPGEEIFEFLAEIGIITLLFRVGLESNLMGLVHQLPQASKILAAEVFFNTGIGFATAYWLLDIALLPSLFITIALTATSVGVSLGVWQQAEAVSSQNGELLLDVAELDDIAGVVLMALLFAIAPVVREQGTGSLLPVIAQTSVIFFFKAIVFGAVCLFFSRYVERGLTQFFLKTESPPDPMLEMVGIGFMIAALAGILGFSVAIGAFFAGLLFSRDPQAVKFDASFGSLYELFTPFFFIGIGLQIAPNTLMTSLGIGSILLIAAVLGKVIGAGVPALLTTGATGAALIGVSMIPRAEISMIVMQRGLSLGDWAVPPHIFAAIIVVCALTSLIGPITLRRLLKRWPQLPAGET